MEKEEGGGDGRIWLVCGLNPHFVKVGQGNVREGKRIIIVTLPTGIVLINASTTDRESSMLGTIVNHNCTSGSAAARSMLLPPISEQRTENQVQKS